MSTKKYNKSTSPPTKTFADHLGELRGRLAWIGLVFVVASALAYNVREQLVSIVLSPIGHQKLVYLTPAGGFAFIFQVTMYAGILVTIPVIVYHLYKFVSPALPEHMRSKSIRMVFFATLLTMIGVSFGYFVAIPAALQFLTAFAGDFVEANLTADSYLSFVVAYVLGLGLLFQLPLFLVMWNWIHPFKPGGLLGTQRFVLVGAFIAAALITPTPDVLNQCLIAVPIIGIYQLGVIAVYVMNRKSRRRVATQLPPRPDGGVIFDEAFFESEEPVPAQSRPVSGRVMDVASPAAITIPTAEPYIPHKVRAASKPPVAAKPKGSLDGFRKVRSSSLGVPTRPAARPPRMVTRPTLQRDTSGLYRRTNTNIDGFTFV